jgi:hypothetical protein
VNWLAVEVRIWAVEDEETMMLIQLLDLNHLFACFVSVFYF